MTKVRRLSLLPLALSALLVAAAPLGAEGLPRATPEEVGMSAERLERLTEVLQGHVDEGRLAGGVALVARRGKVAFFEAFGQRDREAQAPMRRDDIFRIASQTKALVSVAAMMLQEDGRLLISHPVARYLPAFAETTVAVPTDAGYEVVPARSPITVRQLLTHTAGVGYGGGPAEDRWQAAEIQGWYFADRDEPVRATVERMAALPFEAQPGESWVYGYSTDILGAVVEVASGLPLDELLRTRIFEPLGMRDTHFYLPPEKRDRLTAVYSATEDGGIERAPDPGGMTGQGAYVDGPRRSFSGGAGLLSTAEDYARFLQALLDGGLLNGARILAPSTVRLMTTNHVGDLFPWTEGTGFGLGFSVLEDLGERGQPGSLGEFGWGGAYHSTYWVDPSEELVVVYLTQLIPSRDLDDADRLRALVYAAILDGE
jgi:CubicO group peptidase (beta-lactamase class C family)